MQMSNNMKSQMNHNNCSKYFNIFLEVSYFSYCIVQTFLTRIKFDITCEKLIKTIHDFAKKKFKISQE